MHGNSNSRNCPDNKASDESIKNASSNDLFQIKAYEKNPNKVITGNMNINYPHPKTFDQLKELVLKYLDMLVITETKLDDTFSTSQFLVDGISEPF